MKICCGFMRRKLEPAVEAEQARPQNGCDILPDVLSAFIDARSTLRLVLEDENSVSTLSTNIERFLCRIVDRALVLQHHLALMRGLAQRFKRPRQRIQRHHIGDHMRDINAVRRDLYRSHSQNRRGGSPARCSSSSFTIHISGMIVSGCWHTPAMHDARSRADAYIIAPPIKSGAPTHSKMMSGSTCRQSSPPAA